MTRSDATSKAGIIREILGERYLDALSERNIEAWRDDLLEGSKRYRNNIHSHTEKPGSGFTKEQAETIWTTRTSWIEDYRESSGPVTFRKCQRLVSPELREEKLIVACPKDGLRHTWISSMLALEMHRDWIAEMAGNSPGVIRTNYKRPLPEKVAMKWFQTCSKNPT